MQFKTSNVTLKQSVAVLSHLMNNFAEAGLTQHRELVTVL